MRENMQSCAELGLVSVAKLGHSRESGNLLRKPLEMCVVRLDSRFRGNDQRLEWIPIPNDTSTRSCNMLRNLP